MSSLVSETTRPRRRKGVMSCTCNTCTSACRHKPGWFLPGDAELAAKHMKMDLKNFFDLYLAVDWWQRWGEGDIYLLAPATQSVSPGGMYSYDPRGACVFFNTKTERCDLYGAHPFECRTYIHTMTNEDVKKRHRETAMAWVDHQEQIKKLLGHEPYGEEPESLVDAMLLF